MGRIRTGKILICQTCSKKYYVKPCRSNSKYCSHRCCTPWNTGLGMDDERVRAGVMRASRANIGRKNPKAYFAICKGKIFGKNHWNWKGGVGKRNYAERCYYESLGVYKKLRIKIFKRDNFTCQICNKRGGKLELDHIKPWSLYPDLRMNVNNLRTLCAKCHMKTETYANRIGRSASLRII